MKSIKHPQFNIHKSDKEYQYQKVLTLKLDEIDTEFTPDIINLIVLWKVNRYPEMDNECLDLINKIPNTETLDEAFTREVLHKLLNTKGIQLPIASTILRFKNPYVFQIIDQRVYRILYNEKLEIKTTKSDKNIQYSINLYLKYLKDLRIEAFKLGIELYKADRILYMADKRLNKGIKLKNYG